MPRRKNSVATVRLRVSVTPQAKALLEKLVQSGFYGKNASEAAERLISQGLEQRLGGDVLPVDVGGRELPRRRVRTKPG